MASSTKWWGWGDPKMAFPMADKPSLWPWISAKLGVRGGTTALPVDFSQVKLGERVIDAGFLADIRGILAADQILTDAMERVLHAYGKSFPDLLRVRRGEVTRAPDLVLLPDSHEQVERIMKAAVTHGVCLVPFGGGTNIVGGVNPDSVETRTIATLDMRRMNRVLALDAESRTATIQAGALGPKLELDLGAIGHSLGHFPDSFEYSTLGGWLATRSAGMQSDAYGKIEDMVVSIKMVTPSGTIVTRPVPASSAGPDLNRLLVGSEGILGVITEATMRVHRVPPVKDYRGFLFPTFEEGFKAIQACIESEFPPSMIRLQDAGESELAFNMKSPKKGLEAWIQKPVKAYLKAKGYTAPCIMIIGFEGESDKTAATRRATLPLIKKYRGFSLGKSVGKTWSKDKFNIPYLRDYIMDYGCMADVAETSAVWSKVLPLYYDAIAAIKAKFAANGGAGYIGCHISHTYRTGACLYFTFAAQQPKGRELEHYYEHKRAITDAIMKAGGTVSHHHAIGIEHRPWMKQEVSPAGLQALRAIKDSLDPQGLLNPGKLLPDTDATDAMEAAVDAAADASVGALTATARAGAKPVSTPAVLH
jgi:alkyldihydroxyacetonephosphate synthase